MHERRDLETWRTRPAAQQPDWPDQTRVDAVTAELRGRPPLVFAGECDALKAKIAQVSRGEAFFLQGGDCAETFAGVGADALRSKLRTILQMAIVLTYAGSVPVVKVGRIAGQYAKPRSKPTEMRDGVELPAYRGDAVNGFEFNAHDRVPDPERLLAAYNSSAATLNLARAFVVGGEADLRQVHAWNADFVRSSPVGMRYERLAADIDRALAFMYACGADPTEFHGVEFYASHEALLLDYEHAMTRIDSRTGMPYNTSGHFIWVGERTRQLDGAHVEFVRQLHNPLGVKVGPTMSVDEVVELAERLDPNRDAGRLSFITRMGAKQIRDVLPPLVEKVDARGLQVAWICDPMHGNTFETPSGIKTRRFDDVLDEVRGFFEVHAGLGTMPGGIHVELTGDDVTECVGGGHRLAEADLVHRYETVCDPRLNREQSLELAFLVAEMLTQPGAPA